MKDATVVAKETRVTAVGQPKSQDDFFSAFGKNNCLPLT